jgi:hypothetical protein
VKLTGVAGNGQRGGGKPIGTTAPGNRACRDDYNLETSNRRFHTPLFGFTQESFRQNNLAPNTPTIVKVQGFRLTGWVG